MAYIDIITLAEAKNYLRIDDTLTEDDNSIVRMINAAFSWIEARTNVYVVQRNKTYDLINGVARIYDFPINTDLSTVTEHTFTKKGLYYIVCNDTNETSELTLDIGTIDPLNVSYELIQVAFEIIEYYYNQSKDEQKKGTTITEELSPMSMDFININKRFIV
jgi:hypothetical protein